MGVSIEDESTVMTVSQGINRPKGAYSALNFRGRRVPAVLSANKLIGESDSIWRGGTTAKDRTGVFVKACTGRPGIGGDDDGGKGMGFGGGGGLKTCNGRTTVCTTSGWLLMLLVPRGVVAVLGVVWR